MILVSAIHAADPSINYDAKSRAVIARGVNAALLRQWRTEPPADWTQLLSVHVGESKTAMLGSYVVGEDSIRFVPRFAFEFGLKYRVELRIPGHKVATAQFLIPKPAAGKPTEVVAIFPSAERLPENQLRFYVHFSARMQRGDVYDHIRLLNAHGKEVEKPFLELGEELWDPDGVRFTLFLHPGRVKRGLKPREDFGPVLEEGKTYSLVIDRKWLDANRDPLKSEFRKRFIVDKMDEIQPDPDDWKLNAPDASTTDPLTVLFPESLDHGMLHRVLWVVDAAGNRIDGTVATAKAETVWRFTPTAGWKAGNYKLVVDTALEDLAGNSIARPFELDVFRKVDRGVARKTSERKFTIK
jgi:hypothetical protein